VTRRARQRRARVRAAFFAARRRTTLPFVRAPFFAAAERLATPRFEAALRAWRASDERLAAERPSRFNAVLVARERRRDGAAWEAALRVSCFALRFVAAEAVFDAGSFTPARRAFDKPIAIA